MFRDIDWEQYTYGNIGFWALILLGLSLWYALT